MADAGDGPPASTYNNGATAGVFDRTVPRWEDQRQIDAVFAWFAVEGAMRHGHVPLALDWLGFDKPQTELVEESVKHVTNSTMVSKDEFQCIIKVYRRSSSGCFSPRTRAHSLMLALPNYSADGLPMVASQWTLWRKAVSCRTSATGDWHIFPTWVPKKNLIVRWGPERNSLK